MTDAATNGAPSAAEATTALARLREMSADLRGAAILAADGSVLAASGDPKAWAKAAGDFFAAADGAGTRRATRAHVATEDGEAFALRDHGLAIVAVTARFALASLMLFDMRSVLRDLASAPGAGAS